MHSSMINHIDMVIRFLGLDMFDSKIPNDKIINIRNNNYFIFSYTLKNS